MDLFSKSGGVQFWVGISFQLVWCGRHSPRTFYQQHVLNPRISSSTLIHPNPNSAQKFRNALSSRFIRLDPCVFLLHSPPLPASLAATYFPHSKKLPPSFTTRLSPTTADLAPPIPQSSSPTRIPPSTPPSFPAQLLPAPTAISTRRNKFKLPPLRNQIRPH